MTVSIANYKTRIMRPNHKIFSNNTLIARFLGDKLAMMSAGKEKINIALSGGNTPKAIFELWSIEYADKINWTNINLFWGDERCVPPTDAESNYGMTAKALIANIIIPKDNIFRVKGELEPHLASQIYGEEINSRLPKNEGVPAFDIVFLGMGDDGHTVSIFPHEMNLWNSQNICEVATHPISGQKRVTITGEIINNAHEAIFLVTGANKASVVQEIFDQKGSFEEYPSSKVKSKNTLWLLDEAVAQLL